MLIENQDYFVRVIPLPCNLCGMVTPNDDGSFSVYINADIDDQRKKEALDHELEHIENDDFYNGRPITEIEDI